MSIKNVIFDIGNVLVDFRWEEHMRELGFPEKAIQALGEKWVLTPLWDELDRGVMSEEEALELAREAVPEYAALVDEFWNHPVGIVRCREQSAGWLRSLKERGYKVYLLSNYPRSLFKCHAENHFDFLQYVDGKVVSGCLGVMKPDRGIYEALLKKYSLKAEECLFIDDRQLNLDGAAGLGIKTLLYTDFESAVSEMNALLNE